MGGSIHNRGKCVSSIAVLIIPVLAFCSSNSLAAPITVVNPSFELLDSGVVLNVRDFTCNPCTGFPAGIVTPEPIVGWTQTGSVQGTFRPSSIEYPGGGSASDPATGIPDGVNVAYSLSGTISQILTETLTADALYTLSVDVGNRNDLLLPDFEIALLAGGAILASIESTSLFSLPDPGTFASIEVSFLSAASNPLLGQALEIQLITGPGIHQVNYDNVLLSVEPSIPPGVPAPATIALLGLGLAGIGYRRRKQIKAA